MDAIKLNGKEFPLRVTAEGEAFAKQLNVNAKALAFGKNAELIKYGYCMVAGACVADKKEFGYTIEAFRKAMPGNWKEKIQPLLTSPKGRDQEKPAKLK